MNDLVLLLERRHPVVVERDGLARVLEGRPDGVLDARGRRGTGEVAALRGLLRAAEVLPEIRQAVRAVGPVERLPQAGLVVEIRLDDLDAAVGERPCCVLAGIACDRPERELAAWVVEDRAREPACLRASGAGHGDDLLVCHCFLLWAVRALSLNDLRQ